MADLVCPRCGLRSTFVRSRLPGTCMCLVCQSQLDWRMIPGCGPDCRPVSESSDESEGTAGTVSGGASTATGAGSAPPAPVEPAAPPAPVEPAGPPAVVEPAGPPAVVEPAGPPATKTAPPSTQPGAQSGKAKSDA
jgi:hypothetical protein